RSRLEMGVSVPGEPAVSRIDLSSADAPQLASVVVNRVRPLLRGLEVPADLPPSFPFPPNFIPALQKQLPLRTNLGFIRDRYNQVVFRSEPANVPPESDVSLDKEINWLPVFERAWEEQLRHAERALDSFSLDSYKALHKGLGELLQHAQEAAAGDVPVSN